MLRAYDQAFTQARVSHPINVERNWNVQMIDGIVSAQ